MDWLDLLAVQGTLKSLLQHHSSKASIIRCSAFFTVQLSHPYMTTGKIIALTRWTFVGKVMSLLLSKRRSEGQWRSESNDSLTADSFLLILNPGSKYITQDKKGMRKHRRELAVQRWLFGKDLAKFSFSVVCNSLPPHGLQHTRLPCPSQTPGVHSNSRPSISDAIQPSHPLSFPFPSAPNPSQHQSLFQ